jgi:hypothetical protein
MSKGYQGFSKSYQCHHWIIVKSKKMFSTTNNLLGLNVEYTPLTIHMHLHLNYKHKHTIEKKITKKNAHEIRNKYNGQNHL